MYNKIRFSFKMQVFPKAFPHLSLSPLSITSLHISPPCDGLRSIFFCIHIWGFISFFFNENTRKKSFCYCPTIEVKIIFEICHFLRKDNLSYLGCEQIKIHVIYNPVILWPSKNASQLRP